MNNTRHEEGLGPLGIFDSGVGGLTVVGEILKTLPGKRIVYFGDTAHLPYGTKSPRTVIRLSLENSRFLIHQGVKIIVVACNTSSSIAMGSIRASVDVPVVGVVEPGVQAAIRRTKTGRIGIVGTTATVQSGAYQQSLLEKEPKLTVFGQPCPLFVPLVEEDWVSGSLVEGIVKKYLMPLLEQHIDTLILGCTHYPLLSKVLRTVVGDTVSLVDSAKETAREVARLAEGIQLEHGTMMDHRFYLSDVVGNFADIARRFLGEPLEHVEFVDQTDLPWYER
jgi:glutamate racemase